MKIEKGHVVTRTTRRVNGVRVEKRPLASGGFEFQALVSADYAGNFTTVCSRDDSHPWGVLGTERAPAWIETMGPGSEERIAAADAWRAECEGNAICLIVEAFPEAADGKRDGCRMEIRS